MIHHTQIRLLSQTIALFSKPTIQTYDLMQTRQVLRPNPFCYSFLQTHTINLLESTIDPPSKV